MHAHTVVVLRRACFDAEKDWFCGESVHVVFWVRMIKRGTLQKCV